jgi:hypothetical protein
VKVLPIREKRAGEGRICETRTPGSEVLLSAAAGRNQSKCDIATDERPINTDKTPNVAASSVSIGLSSVAIFRIFWRFLNPGNFFEKQGIAGYR